MRLDDEWNMQRSPLNYTNEVNEAINMDGKFPYYLKKHNVILLIVFPSKK